MRPPSLPRRPAATLAALAWLLLAGGCHDPSAQAEDSAEHRTAVELERVAARRVAPALRVPGLVEAHSRIELAFRVAGFIERFAVDEGDRVRRGDLLAELDGADFEREARSAEASLARALAHARDAHQTFERQQHLRERGTASQESYDRALSADEMARAEVAEARTLVEQARDRLAKTRLLAPIDGAIEARLAEPHELASTESPVLVLTALERVNVRASVADWAAAGLSLGRRARIFGPLRPDEPLEGEIARIGVAADAATRTIPFEVELDNRDGALLPQLAVEVEIETGEPRRELLVPMSAVLRDADTRPFCFLAVERDGVLRAERRRVTTGDVHGERIAIASGLSEGDQLVVRGQHFLRAGDALNPVAE